MTLRSRGTPPDRRWRWLALLGAFLVAGGLGAHLALSSLGSGNQAPARPSASNSRAAPSTGGTAAPDGSFTTASGSTATIASLRGRPALVWFVAGGCATCAASIPAVAQHTDQLTADGVQVVILGLYGDFPQGRQGVAQLLAFGQAAAGKSVTHAGWTWGVASKALSLAYDPSGTPDLYVLVGAGGQIRYRDSVPVSTMPRLLAAAARFRTSATKPGGAVIPCC